MQKTWPGFSLLLVVPIEGKDKLRKEMLSKKEPALGVWGGPQPVKIAKIRKLTVEKVSSEDNANRVVDISLKRLGMKLMDIIHQK